MQNANSSAKLKPDEAGGAPAFPIVAVGASAGGLEAFRKLFGAVPADAGLAFILVQHLDPNHESMLVDLLAHHTKMKVRQAADGMPIERAHVYVIPPGAYLSVSKGVLHISEPEAPHGARLPFDFLLQSLAEAFGVRVACVVLSGTGADGSVGVRVVKQRGGLVIAQDPEEAAWNGMPRNAILTGAVDLVLPAADIPAAILKRELRALEPPKAPAAPHRKQGWLTEITNLLREKTSHDFRLYKPGTLQRRIERRMALHTDDVEIYLQKLRNDPAELALLSNDLMINVTNFFRDPKVFDLLARDTIPALVAEHPAGRPLRIWVVGCSTGEETYSLAMLFHEAMAAAQRTIKLQFFASDIDADAIAAAREGLYPFAIEADVSASRLARFFIKEENGYRISPELRSEVVFTVQDVLTDPPFSRLDLICCRNLLIYLGPEGQEKVMALFHFALREGGILLLGNAEMVSGPPDRFSVIAKAERIYRHVSKGRPGDFVFPSSAGFKAPGRQDAASSPSRQTFYAELTRRLALETLGPAAVLINRKNECLFSLGSTDRYLSLAPGAPTNDILAMARQGLKAKLRSAIHRAFHDGAPISVSACRLERDGAKLSFGLSVRPVRSEGEELALVCFVDAPEPSDAKEVRVGPGEVSRVQELERELEAMRLELEAAIQNLEQSNEEQKAINEEALSVNEEFQSANEELLTSKEELQSLNEELTALNGQLQETLDRQRTTSDDLQNVLYSTDVATIFLDQGLKIRFFTPATKSLFSVLPGDVGRPLEDLNFLAADEALLADARAVLVRHQPLEKEIAARNGNWYLRRVQPYRTRQGGVEGVVITFNDISERKRTLQALQEAKRQAELADSAKSRFLAAASHDLRQPLQALTIYHGLLARTADDEKSKTVVARVGDALSAMSDMINALLDINQIETGAVHPHITCFRVDDLLAKLCSELAYAADAKKIVLRRVPSRLWVSSDLKLLAQMVRNLLSNALKYTRTGKILVGCRRRGEKLDIEVWDSGIGIAKEEIDAIFEEYHQVGNEARERSLGLGLGLSIVRRLGLLLDHRVRVDSKLGRGSVFTIEVPIAPGDSEPRRSGGDGHSLDSDAVATPSRKVAILVVEDAPELRELLELVLTEKGHKVAAAPNGLAALEAVRSGAIMPDLILADFNLPKGMNGLAVATQVQEACGRHIPTIILTGDISLSTLNILSAADCMVMSKPVKPEELQRAIQQALASAPETG